MEVVPGVLIEDGTEKGGCMKVRAACQAVYHSLVPGNNGGDAGTMQTKAPKVTPAGNALKVS